VAKRGAELTVSHHALHLRRWHAAIEERRAHGCAEGVKIGDPPAIVAIGDPCTRVVLQACSTTDGVREYASCVERRRGEKRPGRTELVDERIVQGDLIYSRGFRVSHAEHVVIEIDVAPRHPTEFAAAKSRVVGEGVPQKPTTIASDVEEPHKFAVGECSTFASPIEVRIETIDPCAEAGKIRASLTSEPSGESDGQGAKIVRRRQRPPRVNFRTHRTRQEIGREVGKPRLAFEDRTKHAKKRGKLALADAN
jgi:hypothetical protein